MIEKDTVRLLRECDSGVKMGVASIDEVLDNVTSELFRRMLKDCRAEHEKLRLEVQSQLERFHDEGKEPNPIAKGMSWIKTNVKLGMDESDATVAELMTDGCNMGVKSLNKYLNEYKAADELSKDIAKRLINLEEKLAVDIRQFLSGGKRKILRFSVFFVCAFANYPCAFSKANVYLTYTMPINQSVFYEFQ